MANRSLWAVAGRWYGSVDRGPRGKRGRAQSTYACNWSSGSPWIDTFWSISCGCHARLQTLRSSALRELYYVSVLFEVECLFALTGCILTMWGRLIDCSGKSGTCRVVWDWLVWLLLSYREPVVECDARKLGVQYTKKWALRNGKASLFLIEHSEWSQVIYYSDNEGKVSWRISLVCCYSVCSIHTRTNIILFT